ncbi:SpoIIE family protein phosphatase [Methanobacterium petrolearium]|uniref:SpoIIE family protein phosphatase n=1 Tax=Methanobacterium petrolearium TaxID=710190 RepID=UPI001AE8101E|nr:PP2C family protein-serine/threonine phosphatase [Methanobacterium petrolearium]MBP1945858.1 sigma-B regulation protein RsbU (phosphoserine phosphatase) [Methanobacterium petrolearium]
MNERNCSSSSLKFNVVRLLLCSVTIFIIEFVSNIFIPVIPVLELGPGSALPPTLGLMFGPWGAAGVALGNLTSNILAGYPPETYVTTLFIQFFYGYIPYKLWYTLDIGEKISSPRLDTVKNLIKFVVIMFINAIIMAGLLGFLMDSTGSYDLVSLTTLIYAVNNFDFSIMLGSLIIIAANIYGIRMYKPKIVKKPLVSPKIFDVIAISAIIIAVANTVYSAFSDPDIWAFAAGAISYSLIFLYLLKPVTKQIKEKTSEIKISLTEKLIVIFIITGAIIAIVTGIRSILTITGIEGAEILFWESVYLNITIILTIFYVSAIGFLWYIEKNITTPIESISDIVKNYVGDSEDITNSSEIISECEQYITKESEVGILANSFQKMVRDLEIYVKNLKQVTTEKERINTELNVAKKIQEDMLPRKFPPFPERNEFDIYAMALPAKEVGGDFYDFFLVDDNHLAIIIADVSGKGVPAALFMVITKTLIKNQTQLGKSAAEVFTTVNNQLYEGNDENMFVTAFMGVLEIDTGIFTYVNAGHNPPLIKYGRDEYGWLKAKPGFVLAGMKNVEYHQKEITLKTGDRIYLYTDGVTEATNSSDELFGDSRLLETMNNKKGLNLSEQLTYVKGEIDVFMGDEEQFDDITMLIIEYKK